MKTTQVKTIAKLITEDPDIFSEMMSGSMTSASMMDADPGSDIPLTSTEITNQTNDIEDNEASDEVADELRAEQEEELAEKEQRRRMLEPQMDQMGKSIGALDQGIGLGASQARDIDQSLGGLDTDMAALKTALQSFEKAAL